MLLLDICGLPSRKGKLYVGSLDLDRGFFLYLILVSLSIVNFFDFRWEEDNGASLSDEEDVESGCLRRCRLPALTASGTVV